MKKQYLSTTALMCVAVVLGSGIYGSNVFAQTTDTTATSTASTTSPATTAKPDAARIAELLAQIQKLTELLNSLRSQMATAQGQLQTITGELRGGLGEGATGDDVKQIQQVLASDPSVYPAGRMTGFFGPMTKEALMKFQAKHGLTVTGMIDPETRAALEAMIKEHQQTGQFRTDMFANGDFKEKMKERIEQACKTDQASDPRCAMLSGKYKWSATNTPPVMRPMMPRFDDNHNGSSTMPWSPRRGRDGEHGSTTAPRPDDHGGESHQGGENNEPEDQ